MRINFSVTLNPEAAIQSAVDENAGSLSGIGPDGTSEYEVTDTSVTFNPDTGAYDVEVEYEHVTGKFASKDDVYEVLVDGLDSLDDVEVEVS